MAATQVRFSDDLYARLKEHAAKELRSLNSEIVLRVRRSFEPERDPDPEPKPSR